MKKYLIILLIMFVSKTAYSQKKTSESFFNYQAYNEFACCVDSFGYYLAVFTLDKKKNIRELKYFFLKGGLLEEKKVEIKNIDIRDIISDSLDKTIKYGRNTDIAVPFIFKKTSFPPYDSFTIKDYIAISNLIILFNNSRRKKTYLSNPVVLSFWPTIT